ncbi:MAG TPA: DNA replication/repair protein RecF [Gammaproteobacteria bacterium]|nr:DNA replication/repair protein RecF [Gammaproteobacteria bacterium]
MPLERVRIRSLRCLSLVEVHLDAERNYVYGPNGAGKTSFLEGLYLLSRGRSFRTRHTKRLIQRGADALSVFGESSDAHGARRIGIEVGGAGLTIQVGQESSVGMAELARIIRADIIDPSVHRLVEGSPTERRRFLDWGAFHVEPTFLSAWRRYRRALSQRNAALKAGTARSGVAAWDAPLLEAAGDVDAARLGYVERLGPIAAEVGRSLLGQPLGVEYFRGWSAPSLEAALESSWRRDAMTGFTQVGPHRADLVLTLGGAPVAEQASRGQQKLAAASLVIAQVRALGSAEGDALLLLDDPAAELDKGALGRLLEILADTPAQLVFTGLSEAELPPVPGFPVFHVEQGRLDRWYNTAV